MAEGLMARLTSPDALQYLAGVGAGLSRADAGRGFDISATNQQYIQTQQNNAARERLKGLMGQFGLNPQQQSVLDALPVELQQEVLAGQAFPKPGKISDMERAWALLSPEERQQAAKIAAGLQAKAGADQGEKYYGTVIQGYDAEGNPVLMQPGNQGGVNVMRMPEGVRATPNNLTKVDTGTGTAMLDPRTGKPVSVIEKDVAGEASAAAAGRVQGQGAAEAKAGLQQARSAANRVMKNISELRNHPYLPNMIGPVQSRLPNVSGDAGAVQARLEQLQGNAFLQAYQQLKGGGPITDIEGQKATQAMARLQAATTMEEFNAALTDLESLVREGLALAESKAKGGAVDEAPSSPWGNTPTPPNGYTIVNPQTGEKMQWDGRGWSPL